MPALAAFAALRAPNFRRFFAGQLVSLIGTWMQHIALSWLAYRLTDSTVMLGLVGFASQAPILFLSIPAGVWLDRLDRRRVLQVTQALALLQALTLALLTFTGTITPTGLVLLALLLGTINALDLPARQALVAQLVPDLRLLPNAIGLNSLLMNGARFAGPALAGLLVAAYGEAVCFLLNALSYLAVLVALASLDLPPRPRPPHSAAATALRDGLTHAFTQPRIRRTLGLISGFSFLVTPYATMMPAFARDLFAGTAQTYGLLIGSAGAGSLGAALFLAWRGGRRAGQGLDRLVGRAACTGGLALAAFALLPSLALAYPLLALLGGAAVLTAAGSNTLIQIDVAESYRGRVMALFSTAFLGIAPLGGLAVGLLGARFDLRPILASCGLLACTVGLAYLRAGRQT